MNYKHIKLYHVMNYNNFKLVYNTLYFQARSLLPASQPRRRASQVKLPQQDAPRCLSDT